MLASFLIREYKQTCKKQVSYLWYHIIQTFVEKWFQLCHFPNTFWVFSPMPFHSAPEMEILFVCLSQDFLWYTPITIKMVYLLNVSLCSPKMLSEIMRWKGFLPQCGVVEFSNDSLIACLNRRKVTLVAIVWNSSPFVFSHVSSNCLLGRMQSSTGCMCLTFHRDVFLNAFSNCLPQKMHSHTGCICGIPLCVSNVSSNGLRWWNAKGRVQKPESRVSSVRGGGYPPFPLIFFR